MAQDDANIEFEFISDMLIRQLCHRIGKGMGARFGTSRGGRNVNWVMLAQISITFIRLLHMFWWGRLAIVQCSLIAIHLLISPAKVNEARGTESATTQGAVPPGPSKFQWFEGVKKAPHTHTRKRRARHWRGAGLAPSDRFEPFDDDASAEDQKVIH